MLFDGFDEVKANHRKALREEIETFANRNDVVGNTFVVASRPVQDAVFDTFRHLEVMPLTKAQRVTFLESKIDSGEDSNFDAETCAALILAIEEHDRIRKLAENPLLLTLLHHVYIYNLMELPRRRVELYKQAVDLMLDWDVKSGRPERIQIKDRDAKREVLKKVAHHCHTQNMRELPEADLKAQVSTHLPDSLRGKFTAEQLIAEIETSSGVLRHRTAETLEFVHLTFQEYLTSDYINDHRGAEIPRVMPRLGDAWWREVTLLLAGIMRQATPLVSQILDYEQNKAADADKLTYRFLAFVCAHEAEVEEAVRQQVFRRFTALGHEGATEVIESVMGPIEARNEVVKALLRRLLDSPDESVRDWTPGFLDLLDSPDPGVWNRGFGFLNLLHDIQPPAVSLPAQVTGPDGVEMVRIPAGAFEMGTDETEIPELVRWTQQFYPSEGDANWIQRLVGWVKRLFKRAEPDVSRAGDVSRADIERWLETETPRHTVHLDAFWIDAHPVTVAQYKKFIDATDYEKPRLWDDERFNGPDQPVVGVSWYDAMAYCQWAGKRLPTETEWEKAARGGLVGKRFPWGDPDIDGTKANYDQNESGTTPVRKYPANGYGLYDMAGNVWEWCLDEYQADFYAKSPAENPFPEGDTSSVIDNFTNVKTRRVLRGGSWYYGPGNLRCAARDGDRPDLRDSNLGFRCASPRFP